MSENLKALPDGWTFSRLDSIAEIIRGVSYKKSDSIDIEQQNYIGVLRATNINNGNLDFDNLVFVPQETVKTSQILKIGDIVIAASSGSKDIVGKAGQYFSPKISSFGAFCSGIRPEKYINYKYFGWFFQSHEYRQLVSELSSGSNINNLKTSDLSALLIPVAPPAEQTRIVEKLEELLTDLDNGVAELKAAQIKLTQYRQSLLKSAVEGSLTEQWREQNPVTETGEQLLQRILTERRQRWEQQKLAEFKEKNKKPPKDWQKKYPEPVQPDTGDLPELPEGWVWASVSQISQIQGGIQKQPKRTPINNKHPFLRVANVYRNELRLEEIHEIELFEGELKRLKLEINDILIVEGNGSKSEIGRCALWDGSIENAVHQNHLIRARPLIASSGFLLHWLNSPSGMEIMSTLAATTSGLYTLSVSKISKTPIPLPPLEEQAYITDQINIGIEDISRKIIAIENSLKQSAAQRKNVLKDAFSGKLVAQDPTDEPASVLLEKIKAERAELVKQPKPKHPKKKATMNKVTTDNVRSWIVEQNSQFTFEQLCGKFNSDYESIKDVVFDLLQKASPVIEQEFDKENKYIVFRKVSK